MLYLKVTVLILTATGAVSLSNYSDFLTTDVLSYPDFTPNYTPQFQIGATCRPYAKSYGVAAFCLHSRLNLTQVTCVSGKVTCKLGMRSDGTRCVYDKETRTPRIILLYFPCLPLSVFLVLASAFVQYFFDRYFFKIDLPPVTDADRLVQADDDDADAERKVVFQEDPSGQKDVIEYDWGYDDQGGEFGEDTLPAMMLGDLMNFSKRSRHRKD